MTADPIGGVWSYALTLCAALASEDVCVELATLGAPLSRAQRSAVAALANVELHESRYRLEWMPHPWEDLAAAGDWLLALKEERRCSLIHLNHLLHGELAWGVPVLTVGHSCVLSWWSAVRREPAPRQWEPYRRCVMQSLQAASCVVAPTHAMLWELQRYYGPLPRSRVIPNAAEDWGAGALGGPVEKELFILCAGRLWDEGKNVAALGAVAPLLPWPIHVAGRQVGPDGSFANLAGVHALGHLEPHALAQWYARAAIYALPARYEPFGLTVLEAGLHGCALVLGDIESLQELWGDAAIYVPPEDTQALQAALNALIADPHRRRALACRARARARSYSPARMLEGYRVLYRELIREHRACAVSAS